MIEIIDVPDGKAALCRTLIAALPEWFGIPEAIDAYAAAVESLPVFAARADGETVGFAALMAHTSAAAELYVIAVRREWHRKGVGRALVRAAEERARAEGRRYLTVKTLAAARRNAHYARTRCFYRAEGFEPVEVFPTLWGADNPCLLMIKRVAGGPGHATAESLSP